MSSDKGWIKLHRSLMENVIYDNPWMLKTFIHLCMTVNIKENKVNFDGKCYNIQPGQRITSTTTLSREMKYTWRTADKMLTQLQEEDMIRIDQIGRGYIVTVINFKKYQGLLASSGASSGASSKPSRKPSSDASRQLKKGKNELKNVIEKSKEGPKPTFDSLWGNPE